MVEHILSLDEIKGKSIEAILHKVMDQRARLTIRFPDGEEVIIEPKVHLKPLPELEGHIPEGWKNALYTRAPES